MTIAVQAPTAPVVLNPKAEARGVLGLYWSSRKFPVDPYAIAATLGIEVLVTDLPPRVAGALVKKAGQRPTILVSYNDSPRRQRFSCAHEIGHFIARQKLGQDGDEYQYIDYRDDESSLGTDPNEVFANQFAANLLMPEDEVRRLHALERDILAMANTFVVSETAMAVRLSALNLVPWR